MKAIIKSSKCALVLIEIMKLVKIFLLIFLLHLESEVYPVMDQSHICLLDVNITWIGLIHMK